MMKNFLLAIAAALLATTAFAADPLPSWNDGAAKAGIIGFVQAVTDKASKDYVAPEDARQIPAGAGGQVVRHVQRGRTVHETRARLTALTHFRIPPRQKPGSFNLDAVMRQLQESSGSKGR